METIPPTFASASSLNDAVVNMLNEYSENNWLINTCWPENEARVRLMVADVLARYVPDRRVRLLDVGCFNGYISFIFAQLGYSVTATDAYELKESQQRFEKNGIEFFPSNLNELSPFKNIEDESFDVVVMGEVIEHVLNHPLGLMRDIARILRPGGFLILTTPNPATVMNVARLISGHSTLWGTADFIEFPKIDGEQIISKGDIHYREYLTSEVCHLLSAASFSLEQIRYMGMGVCQLQSPAKRLLKRNPFVKKLMTKRLFACTHYFTARRD
jgi:2-polyprenyl-3-methyl-5-hydroxy-6-metoxy-1,4-benzoquinol methylase